MITVYIFLKLVIINLQKFHELSIKNESFILATVHRNDNTDSIKKT